ncbi:Uncharacterized protein dnm_067220 [Desulfonema magnum]|uniref:Uncharacterized protein n=1 Tax=Desulfonema magnum TaxID=45655 RepID=A0A975GR80_9BACT|nr:Uncharacterized protein dnm_067220 [Desulfonema magnum]
MAVYRTKKGGETRLFPHRLRLVTEKKPGFFPGQISKIGGVLKLDLFRYLPN